MKRASLNLSVNAIIIFVLAFAMLGVGIFVTKRVQDLSNKASDKADVIIDSIEEDPTADRPLVGVGKSIEIPSRKSFDGGLKFYNNDKIDYENVVVVIDTCKDTLTNTPIADPLTVVSATITKLEPSSYEGIPFTVTNKGTGGLIGGSTYICKLRLIKEGSPTTEYYTHSLHVEVLS